MSQSDKDTLVDRLRGIYTVPVNDGAGLLNGKDTFTSTFDVPPIHKEAAARIEQLQRELAEALHWKEVYFRSNAEARAPLSASAATEEQVRTVAHIIANSPTVQPSLMPENWMGLARRIVEAISPRSATAPSSSDNSPRSDK